MSENVRKLVFSAVCIALAAVTSMIKVFHFPTGGSITLCSMLFGAMPGILFGPVWGICAGIAHGLLQFFLEPYFLTPVQMLLDYPLAYGALGLAGLMCGKKHGIQIGYLIGVLGRWFFSFLSGVVFFAEYAWPGWNPVAYSAAYQSIYLGSEAILTLIIISIPAVSAAIRKVQQQAKAEL